MNVYVMPGIRRSLEMESTLETRTKEVGEFRDDKDTELLEEAMTRSIIDADGGRTLVNVRKNH